MSQESASIHIQFRHPRSGETPPFWELERLISAGFARDLALDVLAARRSCREAGSGGRRETSSAFHAENGLVAAFH